MKTRTLHLLALPLIGIGILSGLLGACSDSKKTSDENGGFGSPREQETAVTVAVTEATLGDLQDWTFAEGTARSTRREYLTFENAGRITFVKDDLREGSQVKAGELLVNQDQRRLEADVDSSEASVTEAETQAAVAEADVKQAKTQLALAETTFARFASLLSKESASQQEYDEAKAEADNARAGLDRSTSQLTAAKAQIGAAKASLRQTEISFEETELRAPMDGIVARLNVEKGFYMTPSLLRTDSEETFLRTVPLLIIDPDSLEITLDVPPAQRDALRNGQEVLIKPGGGSASPGQLPADFSPDQFEVRGEVYSVTPSVSPGNRALQVKVRTTTGAKFLRDGEFVTAWIASGTRENVVVAPHGAFVFRENEPFVYVVGPSGDRVEMRSVTLGLRGVEREEILAGVEAGERLVTDGRYQLSDGQKVSIVDSAAAETETAQP